MKQGSKIQDQVEVRISLPTLAFRNLPFPTNEQYSHLPYIISHIAL